MTNPPAVAVDLGSNSFRLLVGSLAGDRIAVHHQEQRTVRLGAGLRPGGRLTCRAVERALAVLEGFRATIDRLEVTAGRACGTAALRMAGNGGDFASRAARALAMPIEVLAGGQEAELGLAGTLFGLGRPCRWPLLVVDAGGGSTEAICCAGPERHHRHEATASAVSLPLGAVSLTEEFLCQPLPGPLELAALDRAIDALLAPCLASWRAAATVVATGGTATALAALDLGLTRYASDRVQGHVLTATRLNALCHRLARLSPRDRNGLPGLDQGRGEIIIAGAAIYQGLLRRLPADRLVVSDSGLLEGILLSIVPAPA